MSQLLNDYLTIFTQSVLEISVTEAATIELYYNKWWLFTEVPISSNRSRALNTSRASNTGRGSDVIVLIEAGA